MTIRLYVTTSRKNALKRNADQAIGQIKGVTEQIGTEWKMQIGREPRRYMPIENGGSDPPEIPGMLHAVNVVAKEECLDGQAKPEMSAR